MSSSEVETLSNQIKEIGSKVEAMGQKVEKLDVRTENIARVTTLTHASLKKCQSRCHVDNPPGRWRGLARALLAMFQSRRQLTEES